MSRSPSQRSPSGSVRSPGGSVVIPDDGEYRHIRLTYYAGCTGRGFVPSMCVFNVFGADPRRSSKGTSGHSDEDADHLAELEEGLPKSIFTFQRPTPPEYFMVL